MNPVYVDIHIHTSDDPNNLTPVYDIDGLVKKINEFTNNSEFLISLTDHNTINKTVYLAARDKVRNLLLGVELHIRNYPNANPYHCHIYFNLENITEAIIDDINNKLDLLYPIKVMQKTDSSIPKLEDIIKAFDAYEIILLPHGGQSHSTFDRSIPEGTVFDNTIERSIYYNQFEGFTARSNTGLERTEKYFKKLGINDFVNLITCTDNYDPRNYPNAKAKEAGEFVPTWMLALPTFDGLRLSLSESSRLVYSRTKPDNWSEFISKVQLSDDEVDIDVELTPGLNVVIGGSSSGKTLFVDSLYNKIANNFEGSAYTKYGVENIKVQNPAGTKPHYISQNYIMMLVSSKNQDNSIDEIEIVRNVFPEDESVRKTVVKSLSDLRKDLKELVNCVKIIETEQSQLERTPILSRLIITDKVKENILKSFLPKNEDIKLVNYEKTDYEAHINLLISLEDFLAHNPLLAHDPTLIPGLINELHKAYEASKIERSIREIITSEKKEVDNTLKEENKELQSKKINFEELLNHISTYSKSLIDFTQAVHKISTYSVKCASKVVESMGHKLSIENGFTLNKEKLVEVINHYLKTDCKIPDFKSISPEHLFQTTFKKQNPKVHNYDDFESKVNASFEEQNKKSYKIETNDGRNYDDLSAGWKTSVILDLILGYEGDIAPLIIDQPEDNLATSYINKGLIKAIMKIKPKKQIILVSHNATIPMLGDAQNIVLCRNEGKKIIIRSDRLEGKIDSKSIVDYIAEITDGGKSSIKKRVKKYNLKKYKEEEI
jgi:DNA repair ATPase RecN